MHEVVQAAVAGQQARRHPRVHHLHICLQEGLHKFKVNVDSIEFLHCSDTTGLQLMLLAVNPRVHHLHIRLQPAQMASCNKPQHGRTVWQMKIEYAGQLCPVHHLHLVKQSNRSHQQK